MTLPWTVQIDPPSAIENRTMLDLNSDELSIKVDQAGIDWGGTTSTNQEAAQGKWGSIVASKIQPNRIITIPIMVGASMTDTVTSGEAARRALSMKVAQLKRQGGVLMRQRLTGPKIYADIVDVDLPMLDQWMETGGFETTVSMTFEVLPDLYGDEVTLDTITISGSTGHSSYMGTLKASGVAAVIGGDYPARCRFTIANTSGNDQHGVLWGFQAVHASSDTSAALSIPCKNMTPLNGAASATGASGSYNTNTMQYTGVGNGVWTALMATELVSGSVALSHQGTFRVWVRATAENENYMRLVWGQGSLSVPVTNDQASLLPNNWGLVDLGVIRIQPTPDGSATQWTGVVQFNDNGNTGYKVEMDDIYFQPLDEGAGMLTSLQLPNPTYITVTGGGVEDNFDTDPPGAVTWTDVTTGSDAAWGTDHTQGETGTMPVQIGGTVSSGSTFSSDPLKMTNFGFSIPSGSTIVGIAAAIKWTRFASAAGNLTLADSVVQLLKAGTAVGNNEASGNLLPDAVAVASYGSEGDLWGTTWTPAQVNASNFGLELQLLINPAGYGAYAAGTTYAWATAYTATITVTYISATGFTVVEDAVAYSGESAEMASDGSTRFDSTGTVNGPVSTPLGDLPRVPPSGPESLPVYFFFRSSHSFFGTDLNDLPDNTQDSFTITPRYRPTYIDRA